MVPWGAMTTTATWTTTRLRRKRSFPRESEGSVRLFLLPTELSLVGEPRRLELQPEMRLLGSRLERHQPPLLLPVQALCCALKSRVAKFWCACFGSDHDSQHGSRCPRLSGAVCTAQQ